MWIRVRGCRGCTDGHVAKELEPWICREFIKLVLTVLQLGENKTPHHHRPGSTTRGLDETNPSDNSPTYLDFWMIRGHSIPYQSIRCRQSVVHVNLNGLCSRVTRWYGREDAGCCVETRWSSSDDCEFERAICRGVGAA